MVFRCSFEWKKKEEEGGREGPALQVVSNCSRIFHSNVDPSHTQCMGASLHTQCKCTCVLKHVNVTDPYGRKKVFGYSTENCPRCKGICSILFRNTSRALSVQKKSRIVFKTLASQQFAFTRHRNLPWSNAEMKAWPKKTHEL